MSMYGKNHYNIVKLLASNLEKKNNEQYREFSYTLFVPPQFPYY